MLKINCLLDNQSITSQLRDLTELAGATLLANGRKADINSVYNSIRKMGAEVDIQTISYIYQDVFDTNDKEQFSSRDEVEEARSQTLRDLAARKVRLGVQQISRDNPSVSVSKSITDLLQDLGKKTPSLQKELEQGLRKAAMRLISNNKEEFPAKPKEDESIESILDRLLRFEKRQDVDFAEVQQKIETAKELWEQFKSDMNEFADKMQDSPDGEKIRQYADILSESSYDLFMSQPEIRKVINEVLKRAGYTKTVTNNETGESKEVTDWNKVISSSVDYRKTLETVLSEAGFTPSQIEAITPTLAREFQALKDAKIKKKLEPKLGKSSSTDPISDLDRLVGLNNMGIFENANKKELYKLLGVSELDQTSIQAIQNIANILQNLNPLYKNSRTAEETFKRVIEIELLKIQDKGLQLKIASFFAGLQQWGNGLLISTLGNTTENATSGIFQVLMTASTNPKTALRYLDGALKVAMDIAQGGVREGTNFSDAFAAGMNFGDTYNLETAKTLKEKILALAGILTRTTMEAVDSSAKNIMTNSLLVSVLEKMYMDQGVSKTDAQKVINNVMYGNTAELEKIADEIVTAMEAAGVGITFDKIKRDRIVNELARANILTHGTFYQRTIEDLIARRELDPKVRDVVINQKMFDAVLHAADATAGKGLGHQSDNKLFRSWFDQMAIERQHKMREARKSGNKKEIANALWGATGNYSLSKFVGGAARWSWLSFQKLSGIALLQTVITDIVLSPDVREKRDLKLIGSYLSFDKITKDYDNLDENGDYKNKEMKSPFQVELERYLALRERLKREIIGPMVGYTIGMAAIQVIAKTLGLMHGYDDDDKTRAQKDVKFAKWLNSPQNGYVKNVISKFAPIQLITYYNTLAASQWPKDAVVLDRSGDNHMMKTYYNWRVMESLFLRNFNFGGNYNLWEDYQREVSKKNPENVSYTGLTLQEAINYSGANAAFKWWDSNMGIIKGFQDEKKPFLPEQESLLDRMMKAEFTRDMYINYKEKKGEVED